MSEHELARALLAYFDAVPGAGLAWSLLHDRRRAERCRWAGHHRDRLAVDIEYRVTIAPAARIALARRLGLRLLPLDGFDHVELLR